MVLEALIKGLEKANIDFQFYRTTREYERQPKVKAENRKVIYDQGDEPVEFLITGPDNRDVLENMPINSGQFPLPAVLLLGDSKLSDEQADIRLTRLETILDSYKDVRAVRIVNKLAREVRYIATGIPQR